jgi:hypothetical protein
VLEGCGWRGREGQAAAGALDQPSSGPRLAACCISCHSRLLRCCRASFCPPFCVPSAPPPSVLPSPSPASRDRKGAAAPGRLRQPAAPTPPPNTHNRSPHLLSPPPCCQPQLAAALAAPPPRHSSPRLCLLPLAPALLPPCSAWLPNTPLPLLFGALPSPPPRASKYRERRRRRQRCRLAQLLLVCLLVGLAWLLLRPLACEDPHRQGQQGSFQAGRQQGGRPSARPACV